MQPRGVPIRARPAHPGPVLLAGFLFLLGLPAALRAQGDRAVGEPFARGKPLSEWVSQATHYIPELRREAMRALAALGPGAAPALPVLVRGTRDESEDVRFWAVEALGRIGPGARSAAPALVVVMSDDVRRVQEAARRALEQIGPASAPVLLPALHAPDPWLRANAAEALGTVAEPKREVVTALTRLLADDSLWVRASAAWAIGQLGEGARQAARPLSPPPSRRSCAAIPRSPITRCTSGWSTTPSPSVASATMRMTRCRSSSPSFTTATTAFGPAPPWPSPGSASAPLGPSVRRCARARCPIGWRRRARSA